MKILGIIFVISLFVVYGCNSSKPLESVPVKISQDNNMPNIAHYLNVQPVCESDNENIHVKVELAGDVDKVSEVIFNYKIGESDSFLSVSLAKQFSPDDNDFYDAHLAYFSGEYKYELEVKTLDGQSLKLTSDSISVSECDL